MTEDQARELFRQQIRPNDKLAQYGETAAIAAILTALAEAREQARLDGEELRKTLKKTRAWMSPMTPANLHAEIVAALAALAARTGGA